MQEYLIAAYLGMVQGLTEFLPVSSSGHLALSHIIFERYGLNLPIEDIFFDLLLHLGTLIVVMFYYKDEIWQFLHEWAGLGSSKGSAVPQGGCKAWTGYILAATFVTAGLSLPFEDLLEESFSDPISMGLSWIFTGALLVVSWRLSEKRDEGSLREINLTIALVIGVFQAISVLPAVSRSGATIAAALMLGVRKSEAVTFSFLLSIPAILGACLLHSRKVESIVWGPSLVGTLAAMLFGWLALSLLVRLVLKGRLIGFSLYCFAIGLATLAFSGWLSAK